MLGVFGGTSMSGWDPVRKQKRQAWLERIVGGSLPQVPLGEPHLLWVSPNGSSVESASNTNLLDPDYVPEEPTISTTNSGHYYDPLDLA